MKAFLRLCLRVLVLACLGVAGIFALIVWLAHSSANRPPRAPVYVNAAAVAKIEADIAAQKRAGRPTGISNAELQTLIADVYHVETSRFIQPDLLWITLPPGTDIQATCQAIANLWAHRSGLAYVRVESWSGTTRLGQGTVYGGNVVTP